MQLCLCSIIYIHTHTHDALHAAAAAFMLGSPRAATREALCTHNAPAHSDGKEVTHITIGSRQHGIMLGICCIVHTIHATFAVYMEACAHLRIYRISLFCVYVCTMCSSYVLCWYCTYRAITRHASASAAVVVVSKLKLSPLRSQPQVVARTYLDHRALWCGSGARDCTLYYLSVVVCPRVCLLCRWSRSRDTIHHRRHSSAFVVSIIPPSRVL